MGAGKGVVMDVFESNEVSGKGANGMSDNEIRAGVEP